MDFTKIFKAITVQFRLAENKGNLDLELIGDYFNLFKLNKEWNIMLRRYYETFKS